ncbi:MAG: FeoB-associated Cys-rich membrane protein [Bythopirellula sp.]|nr:FeoB-associated Cys-rich membrane protein [Bythopirellula sp.]
MQDILALTIVALAAAYLGRAAWQRIMQKRTGSCGTCGSCASNQKPLVQIQSRISHAEAQGAQRTN